MKARDLDQKVTIQSLTETRDTFGGLIETWATFKTVWAKVEALRGREFFDAAQVQADLTHKVTIRYLAGVTAKMRVLLGSRVLEINAVQESTERQRWLILMCTEEV